MTRTPGPKLQSLILDEKAPRKGRMHALWTLIGTGRLEPGLHERLLDDKDPTVRAWAVRAAGNFRQVDPVIRKAVLALADDPSPDVKVQVAIASRKLEGVDPLPTLIGVIDQGGPDTLIGPIVWQNFQPLLGDRGADFVKLLAGADLAKSPQLAAMLPRAIERMLGGSKSQPETAIAVFSKLLAGRQEGEVSEATQWALEILAERFQGGAMPEAQRSKLVEILPPVLAKILSGDPDAPLFIDAALVATAWKDPSAMKVVGQILTSPETNPERRLQALNALIGSGDPSVLGVVGPTLADRKAGSASFRGQLLASLGRIDSPEVAGAVLASYPRLEPELQPKAVALLTQRVAWTRSLLAAVERKAIPSSILSVNQIRQLSTSKDRELAERVKAIWGTVREGRSPAREQAIESIRAKLKDAHGDPLAGAVVFRNVCGQCHKIYGEGQEVGPDITLNGRGSYEQLLSNVLDPSLVIGPGYQATTVATNDGRVLTGLLVEDSPERVVLKLQGGKLETVARKDVEESKLSPLSLMPEGLEAQITPKELADLFAYITLDKPPADPSARPLPGTPPGLRK